MNTKVRITKGRSGNYDVLEVQVIEQAKGHRLIEHVGTLTWQGDDTHGWYGLHYKADPSAHEYKQLLTLYKLASYIQDRTQWNSSPQEVLAIIGAEEFFYVHGEYISIRDNGKQLYDVITNNNNTLYTRIIAANEEMAYRAVDGKIKRNELNNEHTYRVRPVGTRLSFSPTDLTHKSATIVKTTTTN